MAALVLLVVLVVGEWWMSGFEFSAAAAAAVAVLFLLPLPLPAQDPAVEDDEDISDGWRSSGGRTTATSPGMREKDVPPPPPLLQVLLPLSSSSVNVDDTLRTKLLLTKLPALLFALFAPFVLVGRRSVVRPLLVVRRLPPPAATAAAVSVSAVVVASVAASLPSALEAEVVLADLLWRRRLVVVPVLLLPLALALALALLLLLPAPADLEEALAAAAADALVAWSCRRSRSVGGNNAERRHRMRSSPRMEPAQGTGRRSRTAGCFGIGEGERAVVVTTRARFRPLAFLGVGSVAIAIAVSSASVGSWRHGLFIIFAARDVLGFFLTTMQKKDTETR